jgi:hypothetical protein
MNKTEQLLKMLEHPERYSEQQWQEILADDECRELYSLMAKTRSAFAAEQTDERLTDEMIDEQWQQLDSAHPTRATIFPLWRKVAAIIAIAFVGIAIAAVQTGFFGLKQTNNQAEQTEQSANQRDDLGNTTIDTATEQPTDTIVTAGPRLFEEVPLEEILTELAAYYSVEVEYRTDDVRSLRLFYQWEPEYSLDKVVAMLNNFDAFSIRHEGNKLIVVSSDK